MRENTVLVTGGAGYIGSVLVRQLLNQGYKVKVADILRTGGESIVEVFDNPNFEFYKTDIRDRLKMKDVLKGCDAVVHLAAIVGDPACKAEPELAVDTNLGGSKHLYHLALDAGCARFIFASTCSNYGKMPDPERFVDEESPLSPVSLYAETKVSFEQYLLSRHEESGCIPTCLRFATVYGLSPRIRFDLTVNEFTKELQMGRELLIFGEQFWRPYCHVEDLARSICTVLVNDDKVAFEVFNVGDTYENYTKKMIVDEIVKQLPSSQIRYVKKEEDPRDYRVNFEKIKKKLGFTVTRRVPDGIRQIVKVLESGLIANPDDKKYCNT